MILENKIFSSYAVKDPTAARKFYADTLGLEVTEDTDPTMAGLLHLAGGKVMIYPKPDHTPATFTVLNLPVDDIKATTAKLSAKGVTFEQYDSKWIKTDAQGIAEQGPNRKMAWFKDPSGNILGLIQER
jgi:catechol 2,3-dioxygenase-like lactoylglutathione lyase family enzyme